eukprot:2285760-Lingulodinium_polyedra.AAC.1
MRCRRTFLAFRGSARARAERRSFRSSITCTVGLRMPPALQHSGRSCSASMSRAGRARRAK